MTIKSCYISLRKFDMNFFSFKELEATLDQQLYHHGDTVSVNISVRNNSNKMVKKISVHIMQCIDVAMFSGLKWWIGHPQNLGFWKNVFLRHIGAELPIFEKSTPSYAQKLAKTTKKSIFELPNLFSRVRVFDPSLFTGGHCKTKITGAETTEGCPVNPGSTLNKVWRALFSITQKFTY